MASRRLQAVALLLAFGAGALSGWGWRGASPGAGGGTLAAVAGLVRQRYLRPVPPGLLREGALRGMVAALGDPYSAYLSPGEWAAFQAVAQGEFVGVGVTLGPAPGGTAVVDVLSGSPAARAGLAPGAEILAVDGREAAGRPPAQVALWLRGRAGSRVWLTVRQAGKVRSVALRRAALTLPTVRARMLAGGIGYLRIYRFGAGTRAAAARALAALRRGGMRALVLDLRDDPGGLMSQAVAVARLLVRAGPVAAVQDRSGHRVVYTAPGPGLGLPAAVLIDRGTASAAELLAGAIRDRHAGILIGGRTYGKGVVQQLFALPEGGALKLTVARYLTPNGTDLNGRGLAPQLAVPEPAGVLPGDDPARDPQLARAWAWLRGRRGR